MELLEEQFTVSEELTFIIEECGQRIDYDAILPYNTDGILYIDIKKGMIAIDDGTNIYTPKQGKILSLICKGDISYTVINQMLSLIKITSDSIEAIITDDIKKVYDESTFNTCLTGNSTEFFNMYRELGVKVFAGYIDKHVVFRTLIWDDMYYGNIYCESSSMIEVAEDILIDKEYLQLESSELEIKIDKEDSPLMEGFEYDDNKGAWIAIGYE